MKKSKKLFNVTVRLPTKDFGVRQALYPKTKLWVVLASSLESAVRAAEKRGRVTSASESPNTDLIIAD